MLFSWKWNFHCDTQTGGVPAPYAWILAEIHTFLFFALSKYMTFTIVLFVNWFFYIAGTASCETLAADSCIDTLAARILTAGCFSGIYNHVFWSLAPMPVFQHVNRGTDSSLCYAATNMRLSKEFFWSPKCKLMLILVIQLVLT